MQNRPPLFKTFFLRTIMESFKLSKSDSLFSQEDFFFSWLKKNPKKTSTTAETETSQVFKRCCRRNIERFFQCSFFGAKINDFNEPPLFFKNAKTVSILICFLCCSFHLYNDRKSQKSKVWTLPWDLIQKSISDSGKNIRGNSLSPKNLFVLDAAVVVASDVVSVVPDVDSTAVVVGVNVVVVDVV